MANTRNAILQALIEGAIAELMVKTSADNVYLTDGTTKLSAKLAEMITSLNGKATTEALTNGLAGKAEKVHSHEQSDVSGLTDALSKRPTTTEMNEAISAAITELVDGAPAAYDTLAELAAYIAENEGVMDTLTAAIGSKADKSTVEALQATVDALGALAKKSKVSESDLDTALLEKVNASSEGNHWHDNKALLDTYDQTNADIKDAVQKKHEHGNKTVLDNITAAKVAEWNGKGRFYASATQPTGLTERDLWAKII